MGLRVVSCFFGGGKKSGFRKVRELESGTQSNLLLRGVMWLRVKKSGDGYLTANNTWFEQFGSWELPIPHNGQLQFDGLVL